MFRGKCCQINLERVDVSERSCAALGGCKKFCEQRLPSSPDGPNSLLMPPSPPLRQACYARTHHPTATSMASYHHVANSSPTCHESPLPPPRSPSPLSKSMAWIRPPPFPLACRLISEPVVSLPGDWPVQQSYRCLCLETAQYNSPRPRSCGKKVRGKKTGCCTLALVLATSM